MSKEAKLIKDVLSGDARAFGQLIAQYEGVVGRMVYRMISGAEDRQEVAQDVYLAIYQRLSSFRFEAKLSTWVARIAYYKCIDYYKKKGRLTLYENIEGLSDNELLKQSLRSGTPERLLILKERKQTLEDAIALLPDKYRMVLSLYHLDHMNYQEIGQVLKMPDGTVKNYLFRARRLLRKILEGNHENGTLSDE